MIMCGEMVDVKTEADRKLVRNIGRWYHPFHYKHVEAILEQGQVVEELIPLQQYFHRFTRSIFFEIEVRHALNL